MRHLVIILAALAMLVAACGSADDVSPAIVAEPDAPTEVTEDPAGEPEQVPTTLLGEPDDMRENVTWFTADVDGTDVTYAVAHSPTVVDSTEPRPVLLAFPAGSQTRTVATNLLDNYWLPALADAGWTVITPVAPDGVLFFQGSETVIPGLLETALTSVPAEGGRVHVAGVSNGGISSFRMLSAFPHLVQSVTVLPGFARSEADLAALDTTDVQVTMWVGENDGPWVTSAQETADRIGAAGGDVTLTIVPGAGHIFDLDADELRATLEAARP